MAKPAVIAIICARGGSKGLPGKNLKKLQGHTLVGRAVSHAKQCNLIDDVFVTTDDKSIAHSAREHGADVPFLRPEDLAGDLSTTEETLKHALVEYEKYKSIQYDIAVFITPTDIFRNPEWITQAIQILIDKPHLESVFVGHKTHKNYWEKDPDTGNWSRVRSWMSIYSSRQIRRFIVREDTGLACASRAWLWREGRRIGDNVEIIVNHDDFTGIDIHHQEDLLLAQAALEIRSSLLNE